MKKIVLLLLQLTILIMFFHENIGLSKKSRHLYINIKYKNGSFFWKALYMKHAKMI